MKTKFSKFPTGDPIKRWAMFFHAGTEWLEAFNLLEIENRKLEGIFLFWVYPYTLYFSLELFTKAIAAHINPNFDAKKDKFFHSASLIMTTYSDSVPLFKKVMEDKDLFILIKEYENTLDTRFGETTVQLDRTEVMRMLNLIYLLRKDAAERTGLKGGISFILNE